MTAWIAWFQRQRTSTRLAFLLQTVTRLTTAACALVWTRLLLAAMGVELNGLWIAFLAISTLGGLGDLGMGGAVGMAVSRMLGARENEGLQNFLASARALFLALAIFAAGLCLALSPWLPRWLGWTQTPGSGSLQLLFVVSAASFFVIIFNSYIGNVNYACGNVTWPILPTFLLNQCALATQWWIARRSAPLWMQYVPHAATALALLLLTWWFVRISHPSLSRLLPLRVNRELWRQLAGQSFWLYFWSIGALVYTTADRILVKLGFGSAAVVTYHNNYKLCELGLFVIVAASFAAVPKIALWIASPSAIERERGVLALLRLNRVQIFLSCALALGYLAINDTFVRFWFQGLGDFRAPFSWQLAFALSLVITGCGDAAIQMAPRCSNHGLRVAGQTVGWTAALNVGLSLAAMKWNFILGIALATVVAQSLLSLSISRFVCRELGLSWPRWAVRAWLAPIAIVLIAYTIRVALPHGTGGSIFWLVICELLLLGVLARLIGIDRTFLREEWRILRSMFGAKS